MKAALWILAGLGLAACVYWGASHYVVRAGEGLIVLDKRFLTFREVYVDIRDWTADDFDAHPQIETVLEAGGFGDIVRAARRTAAQASRDEAFDAARQFGRELGRAMDDFLRTLDRSLNRLPAVAAEGKPAEPVAPVPAPPVAAAVPEPAE
ncbi:MAG: hypothetical protein FJ225_13560 [Lentisphaerae bacterium]|nr:hypothetical protein [Lentisphaerota bacterium]